MIFLRAFLVGGVICAIGQLLMDMTTLTPADVMVILVVSGAVLAGLGLYEPLLKFAGAGASVPITSFGNALAKGAMAEADQHGLIGVLMGIFSLTSAGISSAIIFGFFTAVLFNPKG
ncbi:MAG: stage V sporulation protein AE [Bacillota bacterium]